MLGLLPSGVLIASGCTLYLYTRFNYGPQAPAFENFTKLRQYLLNNSSSKQRSYVTVEGTMRKMVENGAMEGGSKNETSTVADISVPFLLVDTDGQSVTISAVKTPLKIEHAVDKIHKEAVPSKQSSGQGSQNPSSSISPAETWLGLYGLASIENNRVVLCPSAADVSMAAIVASQKSRRRKLYAGSCFLVLSGGALFVIGVVLPIFRVYKLLRAVLALIGM